MTNTRTSDCYWLGLRVADVLIALKVELLTEAKSFLNVLPSRWHMTPFVIIEIFSICAFNLCTVIYSLENLQLQRHRLIDHLFCYDHISHVRFVETIFVLPYISLDTTVFPFYHRMALLTPFCWWAVILFLYYWLVVSRILFLFKKMLSKCYCHSNNIVIF